MDRAQRVTPRVMVIKTSKLAHFMYILLDTAKYQISVPFWARYLNASERSYLALSENTMDYVLQSYH